MTAASRARTVQARYRVRPGWQTSQDRGAERTEIPSSPIRADQRSVLWSRHFCRGAVDKYDQKSIQQWSRRSRMKAPTARWDELRFRPDDSVRSAGFRKVETTEAILSDISGT